jgi:hypothetical protein
MKLFGYNFGRKPAAAQRVVAAKGNRMADYNRHALLSRGMRPGMWVMRDGADWPRAGILTGMNADSIAEVMLTQDDGTNFTSVNVLGATLRQAFYDEIPAPRRQFAEGTSGYVRRPK